MSKKIVYGNLETTQEYFRSQSCIRRHTKPLAVQVCLAENEQTPELINLQHALRMQEADPDQANLPKVGP